MPDNVEDISPVYTSEIVLYFETISRSAPTIRRSSHTDFGIIEINISPIS